MQPFSFLLSCRAELALGPGQGSARTLRMTLEPLQLMSSMVVITFSHMIPCRTSTGSAMQASDFNLADDHSVGINPLQARHLQTGRSSSEGKSNPTIRCVL